MTFPIVIQWIDLIAAGAVALVAWSRPRTNASISLAVLALFTGIWSLCDLLLLVPARVALLPFLAAAIYFSSAVAASAQFVYAVHQADREHWIKHFPIAFFAVIPILTQVLFWIRPWHSALFGAVQPPTGTQLFLASIWGKVNAAYLFSLLGATALLLWGTFLKRPRSIFIAFSAVLLGCVLPPAAAIFEFAGINPLGRAELLPFSLTLACIADLYYLFQRGSNIVASIDRNAVVEGMDDGWMVLDNQNIVVDMNSAAERLAGRARAQVMGQPITAVLSDFPNLAQSFNRSQELEMKRSLRSEDGWKYLNIRISPLSDRDHKPFGRLALWHDVTERKLTDDARQRTRDEMLVLLNAISSAASNEVDLDDFLSEAIYHIIYPFRCQVVGFFLLDDTGEKKKDRSLRLSAHLGLSPQSEQELACIDGASPLIANVLVSHEPVQVEDVDTDPGVPPGFCGLELACLLLIPLITQAGEDGQVLGCMCLARKDKPVFSADEIVRLTMITDHIAALIDSDRRRKLAITSTERKRVMRDLHDSVSQKLYGLVTITEAAQAAIEAGSVVDPGEILARIGENARQAVKEMRLFLFQMQPIDMEKDGLISLLHYRLSAVEGRADIKAQFRAALAEDEIALTKQTEIVLYYIAMEALNNVLKHGAAKSVSVTLKQGRRNVILEIVDDGHGFDPKKVERGGLGLVNMNERTAQIHGKIQIISKPSAGTRIVITVPRDPTVKPVRHRQ